MLEIYNEKIADLLERDPHKKPSGGLKVRESRATKDKPKEIYVEGLKKCPVGSYDEINSKMEEGFASRTIGSTLMN